MVEDSEILNEEEGIAPQFLFDEDYEPPAELELLPGTSIPIECLQCRRRMTPKEAKPNPIASPVKNRSEWFAWKFTCIGCGYTGVFQYRIRRYREEDTNYKPGEYKP